MPIEFKRADMFAEAKAMNAEAIINTVNCVGVMGKGVALAFKERWKNNYKEYKKLCKDKKLRPGTLFVFDNGGMVGEPKFIINFPTKDHWRSPSKISFIETGLDAFIQEIEKNNINSIVMPALGCGNGGLDWAKVKPIIVDKLAKIAERVQIVVIEPKEYASKPVKMTFERAAMLIFIDELASQSGIPINSDSIHLIMYYLQTYGAKFNLTFSKRRNAPHSPEIDRVLKALEKIELIELKGENIFVSPKGKEQVRLYIKNKVHESKDIEKLLKAVGGSVANDKNKFILRTLILWLSKEKKKTAEQISKIFSGKALRKLCPHKETPENISTIMQNTSKTEPILQLS